VSRENYVVKNFINLYSSPVILRVIKGLVTCGMAHIGKQEMHTKYWLEKIYCDLVIDERKK
jgi:hypothetical protein